MQFELQNIWTKIKTSDYNWAWTHNHLVHKWTIDHPASLAKWLNVCLWTKCSWVRVQLQWLKTSDLMPALSKEFLDIQATIERGFTLTHVRDMTRTYIHMHRTDKYLEQSSIICSVWPNGWVFLCKLSGSGFVRVQVQSPGLVFYSSKTILEDLKL